MHPIEAITNFVGGVIVPKSTAICYFSSFLFYGMGYLKTLVLKNTDVNTYDYTKYVSLATTYFVLAIFLVIIGSLFFYLKTIRDQETIEISKTEYRVKAQLSQFKYDVKPDRRMSS